MKRPISLTLLLLTLLTPPALRAQEVDSLLDALTTPATEYASATFKATRIINGHSIEQMKARQLDFRIHHRFGELGDGAYNLWGLDQGTVFLGLEYGVTDWLMLGVGHSSYQKAYNGFTKFRLWRQSEGEENMPVAVSAYTGIDLQTVHWAQPTRENYFSSRLSYIFQLLIARKFSEELSLQISPSVVHRNLVATALDENDLPAIGFGGRYKLTSRISFNAEYFLVITPGREGAEKPINALSVGFDIETGGHVFQIMLTNSLPMTERGFIGETTGQWSDGGIHLGFNISRVFTL
ncbi:MAG: hypothetical protein IH600_03980 [Bacteroidetes bacterium]|nr:hypothetical protein [Bacteroidota bacterium]